MNTVMTPPRFVPTLTEVVPEDHALAAALVPEAEPGPAPEWDPESEPGSALREASAATAARASDNALIEAIEAHQVAEPDEPAEAHRRDDELIQRVMQKIEQRLHLALQELLLSQAQAIAAQLQGEIAAAVRESVDEMTVRSGAG